MSNTFDYYSIYQHRGTHVEPVYDSNSLEDAAREYLRRLDELPEAERPKLWVVANDVERLADERLTYQDVLACRERGEDPVAYALEQGKDDDILGLPSAVWTDDEDDEDD